MTCEIALFDVTVEMNGADALTRIQKETINALISKNSVADEICHEAA